MSVTLYIGRNQLLPLRIAAEKGRFEVVRVLVRAGADVNVPNKCGALHCSAKMCVMLLIATPCFTGTAAPRCTLLL